MNSLCEPGVIHVVERIGYFDQGPPSYGRWCPAVGNYSRICTEQRNDFSTLVMTRTRRIATPTAAGFSKTAPVARKTRAWNVAAQATVQTSSLSRSCRWTGWARVRSAYPMLGGDEPWEVSSVAEVKLNGGCAKCEALSRGRMCSPKVSQVDAGHGGASAQRLQPHSGTSSFTVTYDGWSRPLQSATTMIELNIAQKFAVCAAPSD